MSKSMLDWRVSAEDHSVEAVAPVKTVRILIVDDDEDVRRLLNTVSESEGYEVVGLVENGVGAVDVALEYQPDVVILDLMMPKLDGTETAKFLRAVSPKSKIVAFSGIVTEAPGWADAFLRKEGLGEFVALIQSLVESSET